jgi:hypothetical protein
MLAYASLITAVAMNGHFSQVAAMAAPNWRSFHRPKLVAVVIQ